ncbi:MAG: ATPase, partial [Planctomycetales bacterium]
GGGKQIPEVRKIAEVQDLLETRAIVDKIWVDEKVRDYVVDVVRATRAPAEGETRGLEGMIEMGASPRASIFLLKGAKAHAFLQARSYATPHDVKTIAADVLRHRVVLTYEAEAEGQTPDEIVRRVLDSVPVP